MNDNMPEHVDLTFSKVDDTFLDRLAQYIDQMKDQRERYILNWTGRGGSFVEAGKPLDPAKTLRPDVQNSVNFDTTKNLFITGDNLEALKLLQESYLGKVDMIYIDPPYNTGKDFVYRDNFTTSTTEQIDESRDDDGNRRFSVNTKENGRYHSDWLSMMYPRLILARNFLSDKGVIFISIDEHEQANLKLLCDNVFGESNCVDNFVWVKNSTKNLSKTTSTNHEYIVCYAKSITALEDAGIFRVQKPGLEEVNEILERANREHWTENRTQDEVRKFYKANPGLKGISMYDRVELRKDEISGQMRYQAYRLSDASAPKSTGKAETYPVYHPKTGRLCKAPTTGWRFAKSTMDEHIKNGLIYFYEDETKVPAYKRFLDTVTTEVMKSVFEDFADGKKELMRLFDGNAYFDNAKPTTLIQKFVACTNDNSTILDFFAGSGTTAQAVMQQNAKDGGYRQFILVQLPEQCNEKSEAYKAGYKTIDELSRERIRRAAKKIAAEDEHADQHDYGFRAMYIDYANENDGIERTASQTNQTDILNMANNIRNGRTPLDLLFGVLLQKGWNMDGQLTRLDINGNEVLAYDHIDGAPGRA